MGFETWGSIGRMEVGIYLNGIPMGFETGAQNAFYNDLVNLNGIPMGFETSTYIKYKMVAYI